MKHYHDLVPISAKIHRKQNRMSILCIVLSVFLVTAIFGMADMFVRSQILQAQIDGGNFHIGIRNLTAEDAALIAMRPDIKSTARYGVLNYRGKDGYLLSGKNAIVMGSDEAWITDMQVNNVVEGNFPQTITEAMVTENTKKRLGFQLGDQITIDTSAGSQLHYTISGVCKDASKTMSEDSYGICLTTDAFRALFTGVNSDKLEDYGMMLYIQFTNPWTARQAIAELKAAYGLLDKQVSENTKLLGMYGQSDSSFMLYTYAAAGVLFVLVLLAGIMMIASSLNCHVAQRFEFFGLMRCIGATPKQVMKLVRKEALGWCRLAVPLGILVGIVVIWSLCAVLRILSPEYFREMPVFGLSIPSILAGVLIGFLTVLLAAGSPAKKAAKVSPLAAVSGITNSFQSAKKAANTKWFKIDTALGIYHAKGSKKNLILMSGSFALSIILFLSFSVTVEFMNHSLTPLRPWTADLSIISSDFSCSVGSHLLEELQESPVVKAAYGRKFAYDVPVTVNGMETKVDLISYEQRQFGWAKEYLLSGSIAEVQNEESTGFIVFEPENKIQVGDVVTIHKNGQSQEMKISGMLSTSPFKNANDTGIIICSERTFQQITGAMDYTILDIQLTKKATAEDVHAIQQMAGTSYTFSDKRMSSQSTMGTYYCLWLFIYGFLVLIAIITIFNIINSISMSVSSRTRQYGVFQAIGLSRRQLGNMIVSEACTYTLSGSIIGTILGLFCNKLLFNMMISSHWGDIWTIPWTELGIILLVMLLSVALAVYRPIQTIQKMSIIDTISAQ